MAILKLNEDPLLQLAPGFRDMFRACPLVHGLTRSLAKGLARSRELYHLRLSDAILVCSRLSALLESLYMNIHICVELYVHPTLSPSGKLSLAFSRR